MQRTAGDGEVHAVCGADAAVGDAEKDIGRGVVFLASSDSDYVTKQTLMVDSSQTILC